MAVTPAAAAHPVIPCDPIPPSSDWPWKVPERFHGYNETLTKGIAKYSTSTYEAQMLVTCLAREAATVNGTFLKPQFDRAPNRDEPVWIDKHPDAREAFYAIQDPAVRRFLAAFVWDRFLCDIGPVNESDHKPYGEDLSLVTGAVIVPVAETSEADGPRPVLERPYLVGPRVGNAYRFHRWGRDWAFAEDVNLRMPLAIRKLRLPTFPELIVLFTEQRVP